jgi:phage terminase large subunit
MPSVKGPDSVINGIMNISEYFITVHPSCKNTIAEFSCYVWDKNRTNAPEDKNNHLMDALRYAFYDVKRGGYTGIFDYSKELKGGWNG